MSGNVRHVINMANSIIGVSILSMPYCFKEAGLVLATLLILLSGFMTKKTCMYLIRSAIIARRRSYELLAFQIFGLPGKLLMELCLICFLLGICISFHVVMGDLAPSIVAKYMQVDNSASLRGTLLVGIVLLVILPLCLLRNIDSLASMSACSIGFYVFLNSIMFYLALPKLLDGSWITSVKLFELDKALSVLPILSLALSCQSNVFEIYDSLPDADVVKMKSVVSQAVNLCCALYIGVGFLGYIAFADKGIGGNIIMSFPNSGLTDGISMFFVISLAISFPLMLFPCRTSIHSLIYRRNTQVGYDLVGNFMPEIRFKLISLCVLLFSLVIGILLPNIEIVLGLLGSTMGMLIALILPSVFFIKVYTKISVERLLAQSFLLFGLFMMVTGTFLNLHASHEHKIVLATTATPQMGVPIVPKRIEELIQRPIDLVAVKSASPEGRKEPAVPEPPVLDPKVSEKKQVPKADLPPIIKTFNAVDNSINNPTVEGVLAKQESLHPDALNKEEHEHAAEDSKKEDLEQKQEQILIHIEEQQKKQEEMLEILHELKEKSLKDPAATPAKTKPKSEIHFKLNIPVNVNKLDTVIQPADPSPLKTQAHNISNSRIIKSDVDKPLVAMAASLKPVKPVVPKVNDVQSHDEERRKKRTVSDLVEQVPVREVIGPLVQEHLNVVQGVHLDTRHLLWNALKIRRRKKKYQGDPADYWDEM